MFIPIAGATYNLPDVGDRGLHAAMDSVLRTLWEYHDRAMGREVTRTVLGPQSQELDTPMTMIEGLGDEMMPDEIF